MNRLLCLMLILALGLTGCSASEKRTYPAATTPEEALTYYFQALNQHDTRWLNQLYSSRRRQNAPDDIKNIISARIIRIDYDHPPLYDPVAYGPERGLAEVRILWVEFEMQFVQDRSMDSGKHAWWYILAREQPDGPWTIHDWGF